jgi:hypothetical protein
MFEPHEYTPQPPAAQAPRSALRQVLPYVSFDPLGDVATIAAVLEKKKARGKGPNDFAREGVYLPVGSPGIGHSKGSRNRLRLSPAAPAI